VVSVRDGPQGLEIVVESKAGVSQATFGDSCFDPSENLARWQLRPGLPVQRRDEKKVQPVRL